jgi:hypothetical protein
LHFQPVAERLGPDGGPDRPREAGALDAGDPDRLFVEAGAPETLFTRYAETETLTIDLVGGGGAISRAPMSQVVGDPNRIVELITVEPFVEGAV